MSSAACVAELGEVDVDWASLIFCFKLMGDLAQTKVIAAWSFTGWAVALTCCISHSAKHRKMADFDPSGSQNP